MSRRYGRIGEAVSLILSDMTGKDASCFIESDDNGPYVDLDTRRVKLLLADVTLVTLEESEAPPTSGVCNSGDKKCP